MLKKVPLELGTFDPILWNFLQLGMQFSLNNKSILLRGMQPKEIFVVGYSEFWSISIPFL